MDPKIQPPAEEGGGWDSLMDSKNSEVKDDEMPFCLFPSILFLPLKLKPFAWKPVLNHKKVIEILYKQTAPQKSQLRYSRETNRKQRGEKRKSNRREENKQKIRERHVNDETLFTECAFFQMKLLLTPFYKAEKMDWYKKFRLNIHLVPIFIDFI